MPDKLKSLLQISNLLLWALCGSQFASAQSGSSLPTFSGDTLTIPRIDVEGYGSLELQLQPGEVFTVVAAAKTKLTGQDDYNAQCASCHGVDDQGGLVSVSLVNCANCNSISTLSNYIANVMPIGAPETAPAKPQNIFLTCFR